MSTLMCDRLYQRFIVARSGEKIIVLCQSRSMAGGEALTSCAEPRHESITAAQFYSHRLPNA